jgi:hypothetical protein
MKDKSVLEDTAGMGSRGRGHDLVQIEADLPSGAAAARVKFRRDPEKLKAGRKPAQVAQIQGRAPGNQGRARVDAHVVVQLALSVVSRRGLGRLRGRRRRAERHRDHAAQPQFIPSVSRALAPNRGTSSASP